MKSSGVRETFLKFFEGRGHTRVRSSSLVPAADPTLLFTNAGMVQFKDCFLGLHDPGYRRATTSQKCVRAGGKHNDLENVGFTARHQTFFEMLGNFSFGDYFKKEAIAFAWELVTKHFGIPADRLRVTVYEKDDEALSFWKSVGIRSNFISKLGEKDNFWAMGETGPCGPCTEIHYDWGESHSFGPEDTNPGGDSTRFVEIWNLVFMQFNRDTKGQMTKLPKPSVDTGAGLERMSAVLQGVYSNYDTDLFTPLLEAIGKVTGRKYRADAELDVSFRVIADHIRAGVFLISDGVTPSNEGRGYVLRRILRRAIRHGKKLGQEVPFLHRLVGNVCEQFGSVYPELNQNQKLVEVMLKEEEARFHETLHRGMGLLEDTIQKLRQSKKQIVPGSIAFKLYDTFGFPYDLIELIARESQLGVDQDGFEALMEGQRKQSVWSRGDNATLFQKIEAAIRDQNWETTFLGYEKELRAKSEALLLLSQEGEEVPQLSASGSGYAIFSKTPFYSESGGQVGDKGTLNAEGVIATVEGTFRLGKTVLHQIKVESGTLKTGGVYDLEVNRESRRLTAINHTATHLLHAALRSVLGERVRQAGSLVEPQRLRFDFTYPRAMTVEEIQKVEALVSSEIAKDDEVGVREMSYDDAIQSGALAFFEEKYGDKVRVVSVGHEAERFSVELCGGTHLERTSQVGAFVIRSEASVGSGVRRIEAITSQTAIAFLQARSRILQKLEEDFGAAAEQISQRVGQVQTQLKSVQRENEALKLKLLQGSQADHPGDSLWDRKIQIKDIQVVRELVPSVDAKLLRTLVDRVRDKLKEKAIVLLASESDGRIALCVGLTRDLTGRWSASDIIKPLAAEVGGTGGGRPDFAQAGGTNPSGFSKAVRLFEEWVKTQA